jgi:hypothetical protein
MAVSKFAATELTLLGFRNVRVFEGGLGPGKRLDRRRNLLRL